MARLPYLDPSDAGDRVRRALEALPPLGVFRMVANAQGSFVDWLRFGAACLNDDLFDPRLRELAILQVAQLTPGAEYEWTQHAAIAAAVGAGEKEIEAVASGDLGALDEHAALIVGFTTQVVRDAAPDEATFEAMRRRHSPAEIVQLLLVIGQYMSLARIMATSQIDPEGSLGEQVLEGVRSRARRNE